MSINSLGAIDVEFSSESLTDLFGKEIKKNHAQLAGPLSLKALSESKKCSDATTKVLVAGESGDPAAVFICSPKSAPDLIGRSVDKAESVRSLIGATLGAAIVQPITNGYMQGCSYTLLPYLADFSRLRSIRLAQILFIRKPLLNWLCQANAAAAAKHGSNAETSARYARVLKHLHDQQLLSAPMQSAIKQALARLDSSEWTPRHTFDHNDLWLGNVMLAPRANANKHPFVLIDWPGANARGYGIYDLIRISLNLRMSPSAVKRELIRHSEALHCELEDTRGHFLAALGRLHMHIENFPEPQYIATSEKCWAQLEAALAS